MVVGPQRPSHYPNIVETPHGQQLGRKSGTQYTHAVVHTEPMEMTRKRLGEQISFHQGMIEKYGGNVEPHVHKNLAKLQKQMGSLPESEYHSTLVSMHTNPEAARRRESREKGRGWGYSVIPVSQR
jgi:hypothetical protein